MVFPSLRTKTPNHPHNVHHEQKIPSAATPAKRKKRIKVLFCCRPCFPLSNPGPAHTSPWPFSPGSSVQPVYRPLTGAVVGRQKVNHLPSRTKVCATKGPIMLQKKRQKLTTGIQFFPMFRAPNPPKEKKKKKNS